MSDKSEPSLNIKCLETLENLSQYYTMPMAALLANLDDHSKNIILMACKNATENTYGILVNAYGNGGLDEDDDDDDLGD